LGPFIYTGFDFGPKNLRSILNEARDIDAYYAHKALTKSFDWFKLIKVRQLKAKNGARLTLKLINEKMEYDSFLLFQLMWSMEVLLCLVSKIRSIS